MTAPARDSSKAVAVDREEDQVLNIFKVPEEDAVRIGADELRRIVTAIFQKVGVPSEDAALGADALVTADLRGVDSHGVSNMLRGYVNGYLEGRINPTPEWKVVRDQPSAATIDCDRGLGIIIGPKAMEIAIQKAKETGMGAVAMRNGRHMGMASYHAMLALKHDMIGMCMTAVGTNVLPTFGSEGRLGTNPVAVAVPAKEMHPFVYDVATSVVAANKLGLARRLGADIPGNFLADMEGRIISEPGPLPAQFKLLPFGGTRELGSHKGYGLAMVVEIMCSVLAGTVPAAMTQRGPANHFVAAFNIASFTPVEEFKQTMDEWLRLMEATPPAPGFERVLTPGQEEAEAEVERGVKGIPLHKEVIQWFEEIGRQLDIPLEFKAVV